MRRSTNRLGAPGASAVDTQGAGLGTPTFGGHGGLPKKGRLSLDELRRRQDAVRFANASIGLEGYTVSDEARQRADRFAAGEIDLCEFLQIR